METLGVKGSLSWTAPCGQATVDVRNHDDGLWSHRGLRNPSISPLCV